MRKSRQRKVLRTLEIAAIGVAVVDLVLYFALVRPLADAARSERSEFAVTGQRIRNEEARVEFLRTSLATMPATDEEMKQFLSQYVPPRRRAFSRAAGLLQKLAEQSGVQLSSVGYHPPDAALKQPLERLGIQVDVEGPFSKLLAFTHALETGSDLIVLRGFSFEPGDGGVLGLKLAADLYMTP